MKKQITVLLAVLMCAALPVALIADAEYDLTPKITVSGTGKISVPADQLEVNVGVKTTGTSVKDVMNQNSEKMKAVKKALDQLGITEKEYKTVGFNLSPIWSQSPKKYDSNYKKEIVGYSVTNAYRIKTLKIKMTGEIIAECASAGANDIGDIKFSVEKSQNYRKEAIQFAMKNARADADSIAEAAGQKIVNVLNVNLNNFYVPVARMSNQLYAAKGISDSVQNIPVNPGEISIDVSVNVTYRIMPLVN
jgi:uncharacterized protein